MFLSTLYGSRRIMKLYSILSRIPKEIRKEVEGATIIYRGIVSADGKEGDLLIRKDNGLYNVVWKEDIGESRTMDKGFLKTLLKSYDDFLQNVVVREGRRTLDKIDVINVKIDLKKSKFKKLKPI